MKVKNPKRIHYKLILWSNLGWVRARLYTYPPTRPSTPLPSTNTHARAQARTHARTHTIYIGSLNFKLSPCSLCSMFSFGYFPGDWVLKADDSEPSIGSIFIGRWRMKMEPIQGSETSAFKTQTTWKYPKENILQYIAYMQISAQALHSVMPC